MLVIVATVEVDLLLYHPYLTIAAIVIIVHLVIHGLVQLPQYREIETEVQVLKEEKEDDLYLNHHHYLHIQDVVNFKVKYIYIYIYIYYYSTTTTKKTENRMVESC